MASTPTPLRYQFFAIRDYELRKYDFPFGSCLPKPLKLLGGTARLAGRMITYWPTAHVMTATAVLFSWKI
jgi:hypothetical protein